MPSWDNAASKKVQIQQDPESHELSPLNPPANAHTANGIYGFNPANSDSNQPLSPPSPFDGQFSSGVVTAGGNRYYNSGRPEEGQPGYHGQSTGGYRGAAPAPVSDLGSSVGAGSNVSSYPLPTQSQYYGQQPSQQPYSHHQVVGQPQMQMPQEQHYQAYPGQATYGGSGNAAEQGYSGSGSGGYGYGNQDRSPTSSTATTRKGVNAPISQYPQQYRPSESPIPEPERVVQQPPPPQSQQGPGSSVGRRPVEGTWRDV